MATRYDKLAVRSVTGTEAELFGLHGTQRVLALGAGPGIIATRP